ncbi:alpha/beta hydrolase [Kribbella sp. NPDC058245]|uniref:poly(ethylene terephthalate) hydrolase family protein n=1 Tax=Kribbella sp. NPDC058245 TaxID=3346399 RepID=UPI0036E1BBFE
MDRRTTEQAGGGQTVRPARSTEGVAVRAFRRRPLQIVLATLFAATVLTPATGQATSVAANPYERGPAPTNASIEAPQGAFATATVTVPASGAPGFGGGTIYYPTSTSEGTFGAVAISPGFTATQSSVAWLGPRLASQGFVIITIDTLSRYDSPASRGDQLLAALDYLTTSSSVRARIDVSRLGAMGHSMGGGGSLEAAKDRPALQAIVPLTAYNTTKNWSQVSVPTLVVGAENDTVAPVSSHSEPFYTSLPATLDKAYLELNNATHSAPTSPNTTIAKYSISWLKRFIDDDTRYEQFICPGPGASTTVEEYRSSCPF